MVTFWALAASFGTCLQLTTAKWLSLRRQVPSDIVGVYFMVVEGLLGTICLVVSTLFGSGLYELEAKGFAMLMVAAVFAYSGIVMGIFSVGIGIAGIVCAIYNANAFIHVLLSAIFLDQSITKLQLVGVFILLLGAVFIAVGDTILAKIKNTRV